MLARALEVVRCEGFRSLWFKVLGETVYRRMYLLERTLDVVSPPPAAAAIDVTVGEIGDPQEYRAFRPDSPPGEAERLLAAGGRCYVARQDGRVVSNTWAFAERGFMPYLGRDLEGGPDTIVLYDSRTLPTYQGRGVSPLIADAIARDARTAGFRRILAPVLPENHSSLRARAKAGYTVGAVTGFIGIGRARLYFSRPALTRAAGRLRRKAAT